MRFELPGADVLLTESDVEQKLIYPLIVSTEEVGLKYSPAEVLTKANIRKFSIDKGTSRKLYYPDYLIVIRGYPLLVIEAKAPGEQLEEAYREARLYAHELNAAFPSGINPVKKVIATNGIQIFAGNSDQAEPTVTMLVSELLISSEKYADLYKDFGKKILNYYVINLTCNHAQTTYQSPEDW
ncbi:type I restriction enzyme HsdR N-terminal domain-containing protein [Pseudomonas helleri]|uniref:type I restriction enzyme HsdR N-terminal domain-containing protein n=1 Tax=Pseudomonas helleri TaxID=1608996 RepID=UPI003F995D26